VESGRGKRRGCKLSAPSPPLQSSQGGRTTAAALRACAVVAAIFVYHLHYAHQGAAARLLRVLVRTPWPLLLLLLLLPLPPLAVCAALGIERQGPELRDQRGQQLQAQRGRLPIGCQFACLARTAGGWGCAIEVWGGAAAAASAPLFVQGGAARCTARSQATPTVGLARRAGEVCENVLRRRQQRGCQQLDSACQVWLDRRVRGRWPGFTGAGLGRRQQSGTRSAQRGQLREVEGLALPLLEFRAELCQLH
jgi:hypothetical protein